MSDKVDTAVRSLKAVGTEITQWENRLDYVKGEVERATKTRDALQAEIAKKSEDYNVWMGQQDAEVKKGRADLLIEQQQLAKDKADFMTILKQHQNDKASLEQQKQELEVQKLKHAGSVDNVQQFITAVRRASGLLGF